MPIELCEYGAHVSIHRLFVLHKFLLSILQGRAYVIEKQAKLG